MSYKPQQLGGLDPSWVVMPQ